MYEFIKKVLPRAFLLRHEDRLRGLFALFYRGSGSRCNICGKSFRAFIRAANHELLCPHCGSIGRNRRLWELLRTSLLKEGMRVLDFSPSRSLCRKLKEFPGIQYESSDFSGEFPADKRLDITRIAEPNGKYDLIICSHVLEHVEDDARAFRELHRVLKAGGVCVIQAPLKEGDIYEDGTKRSPAERKAHFGQEDHVRIYSLNGLTERLQNAGFRVEIRDLKAGGRDGEAAVPCFISRRGGTNARP
jgi:SAM-dependent methyltransferase